MGRGLQSDQPEEPMRDHRLARAGQTLKAREFNSHDPPALGTNNRRAVIPLDGKTVTWRPQSAAASVSLWDLVERHRRFYYPDGEVCSRTDFAMLLDAGLLEKHGTRYEITTEGRRAVLDNLS
jgi:hypothetical protein